MSTSSDAAAAGHPAMPVFTIGGGGAPAAAASSTRPRPSAAAARRRKKGSGSGGKGRKAKGGAAAKAASDARQLVFTLVPPARRALDEAGGEGAQLEAVSTAEERAELKAAAAGAPLRKGARVRGGGGERQRARAGIRLPAVRAQVQSGALPGGPRRDARDQNVGQTTDGVQPAAGRGLAHAPDRGGRTGAHSHGAAG